VHPCGKYYYSILPCYIRTAAFQDEVLDFTFYLNLEQGDENLSFFLFYLNASVKKNEIFFQILEFLM
jgi:hypothetical protein